ncbi:MAG TPA: DEAD/DEAH box helicase [Nocardioidaceae bacterium]|nr:DEAD/DEAH box helicase [Nocardioidaceae bacterium]
MQLTLATQMDDSVIRASLGADAYRRGASYAQAGRVLDLVVDEDGQTVFAVVVGSAGRRYRTTVSIDPEEDDADAYVDAYCTCPVGIDCKHAAAVLIAARAQLGPAASADVPTAQWEASLAPVIRSGARAASESDIPMALQLDVELARPGYPPVYGSAPTLPHRRVRLRPVVPGRSGKWVRTGVSWNNLRYDFAHSRYLAEHHAALRELYVAYQASSMSVYGYDDAVFLDQFGPSLWRLLEEAADAGVELVPAKASDGPVMVATSAATVVLDLTRRSNASESTLAAVIRVGDQVVDPAAVDFIGRTPHGVAVSTEPGLLLARLDQPMAPTVSQLVRDSRTLRIPSGDVDRFVHDFYPRLRQSIAVVSSDDSIRLPEIRPPRLALTITYRDGHRLALEWSFEYRLGDTVNRHPLTGQDDDAARDPAAERRLLRELDLDDDCLPQLCVTESGQRRLVPAVILAGMDAVVFTDEILPKLQDRDDVVIEEVGTPPTFRPAENAPTVRMSAADSADSSDWFDLGVTVSVDGEEIGFDELFTALAQDQTHLLLASGTWLRIDRPELHELRRLIDEARSLPDAPSEGLRISPYQAGLWEELRALGVVDAQSQRWATIVQGLVDFEDVEPPAVPPGLAADLRPYQRDGYRWLSFLWDHGLGGILADDMGLGKTVQTLAVLCRAKEAGELTAPVLVVAPASVVQNWANETARFAPGLSVVTVSETEARRGVPLSQDVVDADVVLTSYALFRIDYDAYGALPWSGLVLDEAQFVKNRQGKTYQCARRLPAPFKLAVTGTPLENNLMDLWSLLSIAAPGLFPSPQQFTELYRRPIERGTDPALLSSLRRRIRPLMLRRAKEQVAAELPPKQEQVLEVTLTPRHRQIYDTHLQRERQKILGLIGDLDKNRFTILKSLTLLRQLSLDPFLVDPKHANVRSSKVDALLEHLDEVVREGHRALVFSQFTGFLRRIRDRLDADGVPYCYLDGRTRNRGKAIDAFKDGDAPVFLISLKAGGFGLNLTEADYCFVLDPWWNPATEAQAVDRTHRIGQDKTVVVYRLVSEGTIEDKVMALKERKSDLFRSVMDEDALLSAPLTADDIKALLGS